MTNAADRSDWFRSFQDLPREHGYEPLRVEGRLPEDLRGTFYRNGPGAFSVLGTPYLHWFDGDGAVAAVHLEGGSALGAARVIETQGLKRERAAGRALYSGFGTTAPALRSRIGGRTKNTANTALMLWQDRLYALNEGGLPYELRAKDLETVGETNLGGVVPMMFSAHPHGVPARRAQYNFGLVFGRRSGVACFELPESGPARRLGVLRLDRPTTLHDFIATEKHLVFLIHPVAFNVPKLLLGLGSVAECLSWRPERGTEVVVAPIEDLGRARRFKVDAFYNWHFLNAFERGGEIVVDLVGYDDLASLDFGYKVMRGESYDGCFGSPSRVTIDPARETLRREPLWDGACDFPRVSPAVEGRPHRYGYVVTGARGAYTIPDALAKLDLETGEVRVGSAGAGRYLGEGVFAPRPGGAAEDDGWLLSMVYDAREHRSGLAVFDARALEAGPVATAWYDHHIPLGFHCLWAKA